MPEKTSKNIVLKNANNSANNEDDKPFQGT